MIRTLRGYAFTIAGIAIGVAGIVALGAMAERIVRFVEGGDRFVLGQISVAGRGMGMGTGFTAGGLLPAGSIRAIAKTGCRFSERCSLADDRCRRVAPELREVAPGHRVACFKAAS